MLGEQQVTEKLYASISHIKRGESISFYTEGPLASVTLQASTIYSLSEEGVFQLAIWEKQLKSALPVSLPAERVPSGLRSIVWRAILEQKVLPYRDSKNC